jgi:hypothetical protein
MSFLEVGAQSSTAMQSGLHAPRRLAYPSVGQLLQQPKDISRIDVSVRSFTHLQCQWFFIQNKDQQSTPSVAFAINLTAHGLQSISTNVDKALHQVENVVVYANGAQAAYTEHLVSRSFGCAMKAGKYDGSGFKAAQRVVDELKYGTAPGLVSGSPDRDAASFDALAKQAFDPAHNTSAALLIFQKGKLVLEKYGHGGSQSTVQTLGGNGGYSFMSVLPPIREREGKFNLDKLSHCPELTRLEKKARNMTARNLMAWRIGRPLEKVSYTANSRPEWDYDSVKMVWCVADKANYAAVVPSSYPAGTVALTWSTKPYETPGTMPILMRELRFTFPETDSGFSEYAAFPWTQLFARIGAPSFVVEADASGTFVGHQGLFATARDFVKLAGLIAQGGKWGGKQILPTEYIDRNTNNPYGATEVFAEGWHRVVLGLGMPLTWFMVSELGYIVIVPDLEFAIVDIHANKSPKRTEAMLFQHIPLFIKKQTAAWATTSATSTTSVTKQAVSTSNHLATSTLAKSKITSTLAKGTSDGGSGTQEINSAPGSSFAKCAIVISMLVLRAFRDGD